MALTSWHAQNLDDRAFFFAALKQYAMELAFYGAIALSILILAQVFGSWTVLLAQTPVDQTSKLPEKLPALVQPADCETVLAYIDNALLRATWLEKGSSLSLARARARYIRAYLTHRGFQNYEIASDFEGGGPPRVDLFVSGERLYSFPMMKRNAKLIRCP